MDFADPTPPPSAASSQPTRPSYTPEDFGLASRLFDRLLDAVVVAHLSSGQIVLWNAAAERLFGLSAHQAIGQAVDILIPPLISPLHRRGIDRYLRTGHGLIMDSQGPVELPAQHHDGESIRVELTLTDVHGPDDDRFAIAFMRDAMPRKRLELAQLELAQARIARSEAQAELDAHDRVIDALIDALGDDPADANPGRHVHALRDFRRLRRGDLEVEPVDADLAPLVLNLIESVRQRTTRRVFLHGPDSALARFDPQRTIEILNQVLDEALRRSGGGSILEVRLEQPSPRGTHVIVRVQGTGVTESAGVGVHVAQMVMQRQGGTLTSALNAGGGLEVVLTFAPCPRF